MSDHELRALERKVLVEKDESLREKLEAEWFRVGRGWYGEVVPVHVLDFPEHGVYEFGLGPTVEGNEASLRLEFCYVPRGEVECPACNGKGGRTSRYGPPGGSWKVSGGCRECNRTGKKSVEAFYVSRFPITVSDWLSYLECPLNDVHHNGLRAAALRVNIMPRASYALVALRLEATIPEQRGLRHPITSIHYNDATTFAKWAGVRIPTPSEWRVAAFGGPLLPCWSCDFDERGRMQPRQACYACKNTGLCQRSWPWGNEPPNPSNCAGVDGTYKSTDSNSAPVRIHPPACDCSHRHGPHFEPARPASASACGAMDMWGNVAEFVDGGHVVGSSVRGNIARAANAAAPDVGFRVALPLVVEKTSPPKFDKCGTCGGSGDVLAPGWEASDFPPTDHCPSCRKDKQ